MLSHPAGAPTATHGKGPSSSQFYDLPKVPGGPQGQRLRDGVFRTVFSEVSR